jgi:hypothetical protein
VDRVRAALPELVEVDRWVCWRLSDDGRKLPIKPTTGGLASSTDSATWGSFAQAAAWYLRHDVRGLGFVLGDGFAGVDLDDCADDDGNLNPFAWGVIERMNSYTELSPSGHGVHILVRSEPGKALKTEVIEVYSRGRYFTITGRVVNDSPIQSRTDELQALVAEYAPKTNGTNGAASTIGRAAPGDAYMGAALVGETRRVATAPNHTRNNTLNSAAFSLATIPDLPESVIEGALLSAAIAAGLPESASRATINSGITAGRLHPRALQAERPAGGHAPMIGEPAPAGAPQALEEPADYGADVPQGAIPTVQPAATGRRTRWSAGELLTAELPPTPWLIPGLIPIGLVILAGRRKLGKSFLALQMAGAIGSGGDFLGQRIAQGRCLYLALEDTAARLQTRMRMQSWQPGAQVDFALTWPALDDGGLVNLQDELTAGAYNLLVVDTLSRCLTRRQNQNDVGDMTFALSALQHLAFSRSMTILLIDHHTKGNQALDLADPVDDLLGSSGKGAVADAVFGLYRPRGQREVKLLGRGRDFDELSFDLRFDVVTGCWQHDTPTLTFPQQAIIDALQRSGPMTAAKIARATEQDRSNSYARLQELVARNLITFDVTSKEYDVP